MTTKTGTREWADRNVNCCTGCAHACLYCYARYMALRFGRIARGEDWATERVDPKRAYQRRRKYQGVVMFPTTHDLSANNLPEWRACLTNLLAAENRVLVVTKSVLVPQVLDDCLRTLSARCGKDAGSLADLVEVRATITTLDREQAAFWEPGAPVPAARLEALRDCARLGVKTSLSIEPCLDVSRLATLVDWAKDVYRRRRTAWCAGLVRGEIWIGAANHLRRRTAWCAGLPGLEAEIARVEAGQTPEAMREVYERFRHNPQVRWKDSYQKALGIDALGAEKGEGA